MEKIAKDKAVDDRVRFDMRRAQEKTDAELQKRQAERVEKLMMMTDFNRVANQISQRDRVTQKLQRQGTRLDQTSFRSPQAEEIDHLARRKKSQSLMSQQKQDQLDAIKQRKERLRQNYQDQMLHDVSFLGQVASEYETEREAEQRKKREKQAAMREHLQYQMQMRQMKA